jgi:hypothetical protein
MRHSKVQNPGPNLLRKMLDSDPNTDPQPGTKQSEKPMRLKISLVKYCVLHIGNRVGGGGRSLVIKCHWNQVSFRTKRFLDGLL